MGIILPPRVPEETRPFHPFLLLPSQVIRSCQEGQKYYGGKKPCGWGLRLTLELDVHGIDLQEKSQNSQRPEDYGFS